METTKNSIVAALRQAHDALLEDLKKLEAAVLPASRQTLKEVRVRLKAVHMHVTAHFRFEEQNGYMETVRKREPRLVRTVEQLAAEHRWLTQNLKAILVDQENATSVDEALCEKVRCWIDQIRRHEEKEDDLVQDASYSGITAEDLELAPCKAGSINAPIL